jgi:hypothetical protein
MRLMLLQCIALNDAATIRTELDRMGQAVNMNRFKQLSNGLKFQPIAGVAVGVNRNARGVSHIDISPGNVQAGNSDMSCLI